jgi:LmbE family N-acetylglucosaminyl deacetylase
MRSSRLTSLGAAVLALLVAAAPVRSQVDLSRGTAGTALKLRALDGVKRVLMIAAHPDDEDTALLTTLARGMGAETAYLALTRGDGGQNLIGPELGEGLGVVRTGELLAARELDGGRQFFTRAFDYGFSKSADEALTAWNREELLRDVVWVIRSFRPHVVVSVFSGTPADGHGQHQAAGIVAQEAFEAAADPARFPELEEHGVAPWQVGRLFQRPFGADATLEVETGRFDPVLGRSHFQLAMESRSQHRSQDMGMAQTPGERVTGLVLLKVAPGLEDAGLGLFAGLDTTLTAGIEVLPAAAREQVAAGVARYREGLHRAMDALNPMDPGGTVPALAQGLEGLREAVSAAVTHAEGSEIARVLRGRVARVHAALMDAAGVTLRVRAGEDLVVPGETMDVVVEFWNGGAYPLSRVRPVLNLPEGWSAQPASLVAQDDLSRFFGRGAPSTQLGPDGRLDPGAIARWRFQVTIPADAPLSKLYFQESERDGAFYRWPEDRSEVWGLPKDPPVFTGTVRFDLEGTGVSTPVAGTAEARYVGVDKATGEFEKPLLVMPAVSVALDPGAMVWPEGLDEEREVRVRLVGYANSAQAGTVALEVPEGWSVAPASAAFSLAGAGSESSAAFRVRPGGAGAGVHAFRAVATVVEGAPTGGSVRHSEGVTLVDYPHIERTAMFQPAELDVSVFPVAAAPVQVGYVMGSGDDGLRALRQMGVRAREVTPAELAGGVPSDLDVLVLGIRVYETQPQVALANDRILEFARGGGTVVVQYNKYEYPAGGFAPYPVDMGPPAPRVTNHQSPVEILDPSSPVIEGPNRITLEDFDGWVQERGLYFLRDWDDRFQPVLTFQDPGEDPVAGSLLVAPVGDGVYVYTGISFFRQFPAGVPGAHRLFANLISLRGSELR